MEIERKHLEAKLNKAQHMAHKRLATGLVETLKHIGLSFTAVIIALIVMTLISLLNDQFAVMYPEPIKHFRYSQHIINFGSGLLLIIIISEGIFRIATIRRNLRGKWMQTAEKMLRERESHFFVKVESDLQALMSRRLVDE